MLDQALIRQVLPHRFPILLIDRVDAFAPNELLVAVKAVSASEPCYADLPDHAPDHAYDYPVALLLESFTQAAGLLFVLSGGMNGLAGSVMLGALTDCAFETHVRPGDVVRHEVRMGRLAKDAGYASGEIWAGPRRVAVVGKVLVVRLRPAMATTENAELFHPPTKRRRS